LKVQQVNFGVTVNVPQLAVLLLPPQVAATVTVYVPATGVAQFGAPVKVGTTLSFPHLTVG